MVNKSSEPDILFRRLGFALEVGSMTLNTDAFL